MVVPRTDGIGKELAWIETNRLAWWLSANVTRSGSETKLSSVRVR